MREAKTVLFSIGDDAVGCPRDGPNSVSAQQNGDSRDTSAEDHRHGFRQLDKDEDDGLFNHSINCSVSISCDKYILLQYYSSRHQFGTIPHLK